MEEREFRGVWIPREIWLNKELNATDKVILAEIDSLDLDEKGCYASNEYLADFCQCSERKVSEAISKLIKQNYIYVQNFDGRRRTLRSRVAEIARQSSKNCESETQKLRDNNIENKIVKKERKGFTPPTFEEVEEFARQKGYQPMAKKFYDYFTEGNWKDSRGNKVKNWKLKFLTWMTYGTKDKKNNWERDYTREEMNSLFQNIEDIEI